MNNFGIDEKFKVTSSNSITLNVPQPNTLNDFTENNQYKQINPTIRNVHSSKSVPEIKLYKQRIFSQKSIKSEKSCLQLPKACLTMHGKLELTSFNNQSTLMNEIHNQNRYPDAFMSSFGIRKSNPRRKNIYHERYSANIHWRYPPTSYRQSGITSSKSKNNLEPNNYLLKHFPSTNVTIIDLAKSAQCLIINSLKSSYTQTIK
ncbi:unnamed protein product [Schistosoma rodhaini]|uniref:Uncharacterized protein n=1 Tax=Schistosoma rodhaini TaxID=6188 RepID=A0A183QFJ3_9TREM|nr:unnamed protein product [Schistosoma rodhaini]CAH8682297.1 unnamed protein product [Schistosoma rodhaini]